MARSAHRTGRHHAASAKGPTTALLLFGGSDLSAVRVKTGLGAQQCCRMLEVFLPEQRLHVDVEWLILQGEIVDGSTVVGGVVHAPSRPDDHPSPSLRSLATAPSGA